MWAQGGVFLLVTLGVAGILASAGAGGGARARRAAGGGGRSGAAGGARGPRPPSARALERLVRSCPLLGEVRGRGAERALSLACDRQMPELLDILALGLSAGLSFDASLELYCERTDGELSRACRGALSSWRMGLATRGGALEELARRTGSAAMGRFSAAVAESLEFGSPLATLLERQASVMREEQGAQVQERIEEAPVRMLVPLGTLVVPAMLLAILGPLLVAAL